MCTRVLWPTNGQIVLVGRNMDWRSSLDTNLWSLPRGAERFGAHGRDPNPLRWTARYGSVVATAYDRASTDGVNEAGLGVHLLWLAEADFGERDPALPALAVSLWAQWFLDTVATVAEAVEELSAHPVQVRPQTESHSGSFSTVHLALDDAIGDSAIIEYLDGTPHVHHGREYRVMTNSPPFDEQLAHLRQYEGFGGTAPLPGTTEAADRFVRASYYADRLPPAASTEAGYAALLSVMRNAAQPFGTPDPERPNISMTIWRTLTDLSNRVYAFESTFHPNIVWTRLDELDFTRTSRLDLSVDGLVGDVTNHYQPSAPIEFAYP
ncbi:linear amide C-N hydrolase [Actinocatenispora rupis]|uniref:Choloylglycine hydrolase n=1 Tax=Actinocatenispora rupis TaxID=519421 RepID=A0A8J3JAP8_9ACTN|nr:linear amide C-N hydrolase [Actinocatenispora rupis]GID14942.1 choloylglycine hydrolase [Actinocatenispora rupis]